MDTSVIDPRPQFFFDDLVVDSRDVSTVHAALCACDPRILLSCVLSEEADWKVEACALGQARLQVLVDKVAASLKLMAQVPLSDNVWADELIVPQTWFVASDSHGGIKRRIGCAVVGKAHLSSASGAVEIFHSAQTMSHYAAMKEKLSYYENAPWSIQALSESVKSLAFEMWPEVLSRRIWIPSTFCQKERYSVLGSVFWAITYFGFSSVDHSLVGWNPDKPESLCSLSGICEKASADVECSRGGLDVMADGEEDAAEVEEGDDAAAAADADAAADVADAADDAENAEDDDDGIPYCNRVYREKMSAVAELLSYNCWVETLGALVLLNGCCPNI